MGHKHKHKAFYKTLKKYVPIAITFIGIGILLVIIIPFWVWILVVGLALIAFGLDKFTK